MERSNIPTIKGMSIREHLRLCKMSLSLVRCETGQDDKELKEHIDKVEAALQTET